MTWWQIAFIVLACVVGLAVWLRLIAAAIFRVGPPPKLQGDSAPGWMVECRSCGTWRPAGELGIIRLYAAGEKLQLARCTTCERFRWVRIRKVPGPAGRRRIDERTNTAIWPETLGTTERVGSTSAAQP